MYEVADINKHGLGRYVSQDVKREVRQRCGYGCVICGLGYYDYEHFNPDFKDAKEHNPDGMTILCMQCNQKRARGTLSVETVAKANENPRCKQQGFTSEMFDLSSDSLQIVFAGVTFTDCRTLIQVRGLDLLSIRSSDEPGAPPLLSGFFTDSTGAVTLKIEDNIWSAGADNWDVEVVGPRTTIRRGPGDIVLEIRVDPPRRLIIEKLSMEIEGVVINGTSESLQLCIDGRSWQHFSGCNMTGCGIGILI
ncbi:hypothetical protein ACNFBT_25295 [Pseudomonas sp. NY15181]|uniref:hypothetical protein n=1 Tax=Pseudomonas sp. NY15181 TaxID=3400349 RepID=UPI003A87316F